MKKEIYSLLQWILAGFVISTIMSVVEIHSSIVMLILSTSTKFCDLSFLILQNLIVEGLIYLALRWKKFAALPSKYSLSIANIIVWLCFTVWYCKGNYYTDGVVSLPYSDTMMWVNFISERLAAFSRYIVWVTLLLAAEGIISLTIDYNIDWGNKAGIAILSCSLIFAGGLMFYGENIEASLDDGPKIKYSEEYDTYIKAWQIGRDKVEIEIYREKFKSKAHFIVEDADPFGPIFLRQDSIAIMPWAKDEPLGDHYTILQKGNFVVYNGFPELRATDKQSKSHTQVFISLNPLKIELYPYQQKSRKPPFLN